MVTATLHADRIVTLPTGTLEVTVTDALWPLDALCDFAARQNPRRGFLIVSRVLGRHLPAAPSTMRLSARALARAIDPNLPGPVLVIGLAETAVCLGQTVHEEYRAITGREDVAFLHSTRQRIEAPLLCRFEEPHSHASAHLIYRPEIAGFTAPRALVLVDDEVSTGTTLRNLAEALVERLPTIERVAIATLTDWSPGIADMPRPTTVHALLSGTLRWTPSATPPADAAFAAAAGRLGTLDPHRNLGRLGILAPVRAAPPRLPDPIPRRLRIVGTGEFTYPPFRLAERLEQAGHNVVVQATSRSPALLGGAMATKLTFADNYDTGVPNYLYNADPTDGRSTFVCHETPAGSVDPALLEALDAQAIGWAP